METSDYGTPKASQNGITMGLLMTRIGRIKFSDYHRPQEPRHKQLGWMTRFGTQTSLRRKPATKSTNCEFCYMEITPPSAADCFGSPDRRSPWVFINSTARVYASTKKAYNLHMRKFIMLGTLALLLTRTAEARWRSRPANVAVTKALIPWPHFSCSFSFYGHKSHFCILDVESGWL